MMKLLLLIVIAIGVTLIYDALKLVGFLFCAISGTAMAFLNV